jgi:hypothetical protein
MLNGRTLAIHSEKATGADTSRSPGHGMDARPLLAVGDAKGCLGIYSLSPEVGHLDTMYSLAEYRL